MEQEKNVREVWASGGAYEPFIGRWSRLVAPEFISWLKIPPARRWLDVGCGTGALTEAVLEMASPGEVKGIDRSESYVSYTRERVKDQRASFVSGYAHQLPFEAASFDAVISGLVLNFVPEPGRMVAEMTRVVQVG